MSNVLKIIALSVDSKKLTLWDENGNTTIIKQGDLRVSRIVQEAKEKGLAPNNPVEVDLTIAISRHTEYNSVEDDSNGVIKFFRIAKKKLMDYILADSEPVVKVVPSIYLGETDVTKAVSKMLAILDSAPKAEQMYTEHVDIDTGYQVVLLGFNKEHDRTSLVNLITSIYGTNREDALSIANSDMPFVLKKYISKQAALEYQIQLNRTRGVFADVSRNGYVHLPYEEPKPTNEDKLALASERLSKLGAISTDKDEFHTNINDDDTLVAVVGNTVIPDVQNLQRQIRQSARNKDCVGLTRFLERLAPIISARRHSVEDLFKFMEQADLPIADDGSIVIYKRLQAKGNSGEFVDCHTGKVRQWVGCKVSVLEELVDQNRRQDCSHGLHVASLKYLRTFSGDVTIIGKVAPEDVFAVPEYDATKMRVSAYHIIDKLTPEQARVVNRGGSLSSEPGGLELLNKVLSGQHSAPTDLVVIGGHNGTKITLTKLSTETDALNESKSIGSKTNIDIEEALTQVVNIAPVVSAQEVKPTVKKKTNMELADDLWLKFHNASTSDIAAQVAGELIAFKGKIRKSWSSLGISSEMVKRLADARTAMPVARTSKDKVKATKIIPMVKGGKAAETIRSYLNDVGMSDYAKAHAMHDYKRSQKKSYAALGLTEDEIKEIDKLKHHLK